MSCKILKTDNIPEKLYSVGEKKYFKKNEIIINSGDILDYCYILVKGSILLIKNSKCGSLIYTCLLVPPCILGEIHVISKEKMEPTHKCIENVEVIKIHRNTLLNILSSDTDFLVFYLQNILLSKLNIIAEQASDYATMSSEKRITKILIEFAEFFGKHVDGKIKITYKISQQFISNLTGVKRGSAVRAFDKLKEKKLIDFSNGFYYILDIDLLKKYSLNL